MFKDDLSANADGILEYPTTTKHVVLDVIPGGAEVGLNTLISIPLLLQVEAWVDTRQGLGFAAALSLMNDCITALISLNALPSSGVDSQRQNNWRGVIMTFTLEAAYDTL